MSDLLITNQVQVNFCVWNFGSFLVMYSSPFALNTLFPFSVPLFLDIHVICFDFKALLSSLA